ncbi:MAG: response regulator transcription factor [Gemmatimonadetes bacterium]|nr:response regulator transcription factor [Gemmatimonadota bacterium]
MTGPKAGAGSTAAPGAVSDRAAPRVAAVPLKVLVVDDEAPARRRLAMLLARIPGVVLVGEAANGVAAVEAITELAPDLVLLDIRMPGLDGFEVIEAVGRAAMPDVVFVTAFDEHAVRAFEVKALDYLLKPVEPVRLRDAVGRAVARRGEARGARSMRREAVATIAAERVGPMRRLLAYDAAGAASLVDLDAVVLARAQRNYVQLRTPQREFRARGTIGDLADRLDPQRFLRVNRSDIVRLDAIAQLAPWSHGDYRIVLPDGMALLWSRRYRARDVGQFSLVRERTGEAKGA